jgi:hypothetical protein
VTPRQWPLLPLTGALLLTGCEPGRQEPAREEAPVVVEAVEAGAVPAADLERARQTATALSQDLAGLVFSTLEAQGPAAAVRVCSEVAEERTAAHAADGVYVRRVSERLRNPRNAPDAQEEAALREMRRLDAEGSLPPELLRVISRGDEQWLHLVRPIRVQQPCLTCHGPVEAIPGDVRQILAERYPDDQATGYAAGDLRGAVSVRVPMQTAVNPPR